MNQGNRSRVFDRVLLGCLAFLAATQAGRPGEDGSGAMWVAPELLPPNPIAEPCAQLGTLVGRDLVFEVIRAEDDVASIDQAAGSNRAVAFEWNAVTGELSIAGHGAADPEGIRNPAPTNGLSGRCGA